MTRQTSDMTALSSLVVISNRPQPVFALQLPLCGLDAAQMF